MSTPRAAQSGSLFRVILPALLALALLAVWLYVTRCAPGPEPLPTVTATMTALPLPPTETAPPTATATVAAPVATATPTSTATPAPTLTPLPTATSTPEMPEYWQVGQGETMSHIALWRWGRAALWPELCAANGRERPYRCDRIFPGEDLVIPRN